jgi:hypothetical protein
MMFSFFQNEAGNLGGYPQVSWEGVKKYIF